jgi:hypothetical protein
LETKPKQVDAWLLRLPLSNPTEAAEELADYLATLNRAEITHDVRAKLIERLYPVVEDVAASLHEQYGSVPLPLPIKQRRNAELAHRLWLESADCYKILTLDWTGKRFHMFGGNPVPQYLQRILLSLQALLEVCYETHETCPHGLWVDLHQTYIYAQRNGLKEVVPEGSKYMLSLEQIYLATLLLALADPYHFPQSELPWSKDIIARYANLAHLFPAEESSKGQAGLFLIEVNTDSPPRPLAREAHPMNPRWDLLLNTTDLAKHLALLSSHLRGQEDIEKLGLPDAARDPAYMTMLRRLKLNWGASLQRMAQRRSHQHGREFEVSFGLKAVHSLISPPVASDVIHYGGGGGNEPAPIRLNCKTVNDSMGGLSLHYTGNSVQIRVGDVVGLRQGNSSWSVGLVRWFRVPKASELFFGVQLLAPQADAVQLRRGDNGRQWAGLLLLPNAVTLQAPMLLTLPSAFGPDIAAEVRGPQGVQHIKVESRLESTPSVDIYRFQMASPAAKPAPRPR